MIKILLIRHGLAEEPRPGRADPDRALTAEGWAKTRLAMAGLVAKGFRPDQGVASPYRRAMETLRCLQEAAPGGFPVSTWEGLEPGGRCGVAEAWLMGLVTAAGPDATLAVVSHEPFLSSLVDHLTGREVEMRKASCCVLHWQDGRFVFAEHFSPAQLRVEV
jgi:phosphohistidine phosphatase